MPEQLVVVVPQSEVLYAETTELLESAQAATYATEALVVTEIEHVELGVQGPPGPPGPSGGQVFAALAGVPLSSLRAVRLEGDRAYYCDGSDPTHVGTCAGITETAALAGDPVAIRALGRMEDAGGSWTGGPLFVGTHGVLSALPGAAFVQEIAQVDSPTRITVGIRIAVLKG